jgi:hypothetical protein
MALCDLSGVPVVRGRIVQPYSGLWHADLVLATPTDVSGQQTLNFSGTTWHCAYVRAVDFTGERGVRVVGGFGGWRTTVSAKQYGGPGASIAVLMVLADAASACGEPTPILDASVPSSVGGGWARQSGLASQVLYQILGSNWWVDRVTGVVNTGFRTGAISSSFGAMSVKGPAGVYEIVTDHPNDWQPGVSFTGPTASGTVSRLTHIITPNTLRTEVMVS